MKKFKIFPLLLLMSLIFSFAAPAALALEDPQTQAQAIVLADLDTGDIIYSKNMEQQRSPASLTKIMTVLLALEALENEQCSMEDMITAGADCRTGMAEDSSTAGIMPGEVMSFKDLLHCALIQSANESCNILATYLSGSIGAFVEKMNARAAELGCLNTRFVDPNGLSSENITTAYDLYIITKEAISHPDFMSICNTVYYEVPATNMSELRTMYNSNALISAGSIYGSGYVYEGAAGVKTGYTRAAGYCLISTAERNGINALAVVLGCGGLLNTGEEDFGNFVDSIKVYNWLFENFSHRTILSSAEFFERVEVALAAGDGSVILRPEQDVTVLIPNEVSDDAISTSVTIYDNMLTAPIAAGTVLGKVVVSIDGEEQGSINLINNSAVELSKLEFLKMRLADIFSRGWVITLIVVVLVLLVIYLILVARYRALRRRHLAERRRIEQERRRMRAQREREERMQRRYEDDDRYSYYEEEPPRTDPADIDELFSRYRR